MCRHKKRYKVNNFSYNMQLLRDILQKNMLFYC